MEIIAKGSYGLVSKGKCLRTGKMVALKLMKIDPECDYDLIKLLREI